MIKIMNTLNWIDETEINHIEIYSTKTDTKTIYEYNGESLYYNNGCLWNSVTHEMIFRNTDEEYKKVINNKDNLTRSFEYSISLNFLLKNKDKVTVKVCSITTNDSENIDNHPEVLKCVKFIEDFNDNKL